MGEVAEAIEAVNQLPNESIDLAHYCVRSGSVN